MCEAISNRRMSRTPVISIRLIVAYAVGFFAVAWLYLEVAIRGAGSDLAPPALIDLLAMYYPVMDYGFSEMAQGQLPHWNPYQACGTAFLSNPLIGFFYPLYWPLLGFSPDIAVDIDLVIHLTIASTTMALLCRHFRMHWGAGFVAGLVYAYQGGMAISFGYPSTLAFVAWIPLLFLLVARVFEEPTARTIFQLALVIGLSLLGGSIQYAYFALLALIPLGISLAWAESRRPEGARWVSILSALLLAGLLGAGVASVRLLPAAEFMQQSWRPSDTLSVNDANANAGNTKARITRGMFTPEPAPASKWLQRDAYRKVYVGSLPLTLGLIGILGWKPRRVSIAIASAGVAAGWYTLGVNGSLFPLLFELPMGNWFRGPDRAFLLTGFAVSFLSGAGLDYLIMQARREPMREKAIFRGLIVLPAIAVVSILILQLRFGDTRGHTLAVSYALVGVFLVGIFWSTRSRRWLSLTTLVLAGVVLFDLAHTQPHNGMRPAQLRDYFNRHNWFYDWIRERQEYSRTHIWASSQISTTSGLLAFKAGSMHRIWQDTDYSVSGERFENYIAKLGEIFTPVGFAVYRLNADNIGYFNLMGNRFAVFESGQEAEFVDQDILHGWQKRIEKNGITVYENDQALPRSFIVHDVVVETEAQRALDQLGALDLRTVALVEENIDFHGPDPDGNRSVDRTQINLYSAHRVEVLTESDRDGLLVITDQFDPNWKATIDAVPTEIFRTNYLYRGVVVPSGKHQVVFVYDASRFRIGAGLSVLSVLALLGVGVSAYRLRRAV